MAVVIGIDEAGYGPVLGPLVVSSAAFEVGEGGCGADLWELLGPAVARTRSGAGSGGLLVADSKVVYPRGGLAGLERGVLAFLAAGGYELPKSFGSLLGQLCEDADGLCGKQAWWNDIELPAADAVEKIEGAARSLAGADASGVRFLGFGVQVVPPGAFNELVARHGNKSVVLFQQNMLLVERAAKRFGSGDIWFLVDKHGGRHYYGPLLSGNFFGRSVRAVHESPGSSSYEVELGGRRLHFVFMEKADSRHLPVALASMVCKYVRELFMMCFNAYWCGLVKGLEPTAGYAADSGRFIAAIRPFMTPSDEREVIRER